MCQSQRPDILSVTSSPSKAMRDEAYEAKKAAERQQEEADRELREREEESRRRAREQRNREKEQAVREQEEREQQRTDEEKKVCSSAVHPRRACLWTCSALLWAHGILPHRGLGCIHICSVTMACWRTGSWGQLTGYPKVHHLSSTKYRNCRLWPLWMAVYRCPHRWPFDHPPPPPPDLTQEPHPSPTHAPAPSERAEGRDSVLRGSVGPVQHR